MWIIITFFLVHWYLSIFVQTFFLHRYAAHRMFDMSKGWERFFYIFTFISQGSSYLSPSSYAKMHRLHHAHADTEHDPHSPSYSKNLFDMMWKTRRIYLDIDRDKVDVDNRYTKDLPEWEWFDQFAQSIFVRIAWSLLYVWVYVQFAPNAWWYLLIPIHITMGPTHGVIINWFSHKIGYRNFKSKDTSTNYLPFDFLTIGEGYHNNHHRYGHKANFGSVRWHEVDITWLIIRALNKADIIQLKPEKVVAAG